MVLRKLLAILGFLIIILSGLQNTVPGGFGNISKKKNHIPTFPAFEKISNYSLRDFKNPSEKIVRMADKLFKYLSEREKISEILFHPKIWNLDDESISGIYQANLSNSNISSSLNQEIPSKSIEAFFPLVFFPNNLMIDSINTSNDSTEFRVLVLSKSKDSLALGSQSGNLCLFPCNTNLSLFSKVAIDFIPFSEIALADIIDLSSNYSFIWIETEDEPEILYKELMNEDESFAKFWRNQIKEVIRLKLSLGITRKSF